MTRRPGLALLLLMMTASGGVASAQEVIRCGNSYGQQPCAGGSTVQAADPRSPAQQAQASAAVKRDVRLGNEMEDARLKAQAQAETARATTSQPPADMARAAPGKPQRPAVFKAAAPDKPGGSARKRKAAGNKKAAETRKAAAGPRAARPVRG